MRPHILTILATSAVAAAAAAAPAAAAPTTLAELHGATDVRAFAGVQAWSDYDASEKRWHVMVRRDGRILTPSIAASARPIEVDVGPRSDGVPVLAYTRCTDACRLVVTRVDGSGTDQVVPASEGASHPTVWGRRVAWVRGRATVMTSTWGGHGRRVLPGAPRTKCYRPFTGERRRCERPQRPSVDALELHGDQLALVDAFGLEHASGQGTTEVRTESVRGGPQRLVALMAIGEGGQTWIGPSWVRGRLFFYKTCSGDPSACVSAGGVFGYAPGRRTYVHARSSTVLSGFAMDGDGRRAYEAAGPRFGLPCGEDDAGPCVLRLTEPLAFERTGSQVREP
jgi:hypothetical protein